MNRAFVLFCLVVSLGLGCEKLPENAPTYGKVKIVADETLYPLVDALEAAFEHSYPKATVEVVYLPSATAFEQFYKNDSTQLILAARSLNDKEKSYFSQQKLNPRTSILANDALAFLVNPNSRDTALTCDQAMKIFRGELSDWSQVSANAKGKINLVFDNQASSTVEYLLNKCKATALPPNAYGLKTTAEVVDYVSKQSNAIGIVGYSWLSDYDDPQCKLFREKVKVLALSPCEGDSIRHFYKPFSANIQAALYPFSRQVYVINRETNSGLGTGFSAFVCGEVGQRIISKAGIMPAYVVEHKIELKSEPFKVEN